jgi:ribonucleoside-diphosphate reductase alpha subunit
MLSSGAPRDRRGNVSKYKNITTRKITYMLHVPRVETFTKMFPKAKPVKQTSYFQWNNMCMSRIIKIDKEEYDGNLFDLEVEEDHTYLAANLGIISNGGGRRFGSFAIYIEPWHPEILEFLDLKKNTGKEEMRARDLFYALWMPDLFMRRLKQAIEDKDKKVYWSTFCPDECRGLNDAWGDEFDKLYTRYESEGKARQQIDILKIWDSILDSQKETGTPYILYKDHCNGKSNQQNVGVIKSSNLCAEIIQYSDPSETAVCNLASINLSKHVINGKFDFETLQNTVKSVVYNLNKIIDINWYPTPETRASNMRHRPMGIGVQGLADVFFKLRIPYESDAALKLNEDIFEAMYFSALTESCSLAKKYGPYESYSGSPIEQGRLQFDLWGKKPSDKYRWDILREDIKKYGVRNSLLLAVMPTASTAQILGNVESAEPITYNMYTRRVLAGEFTLVNKYLQYDLLERGLWTPEIKRHLVANRGSVQNCDEIPKELKDLYKGAFEIKQRHIINMAAARGKYVDQSQSMNLFLSVPTSEKLSAMHLYSWECGLKTGIYYLRREPIKHAQQFTVKPEKKLKTDKMCLLNDPTCVSCSS